MTTAVINNKDRLGLGARRGITVTVTSTPSSLATLLNAASTGRTEMANRRQLNVKNTHATNTIYILESSSQTATEGIPMAPSEERYYEMSTTGTDNTSPQNFRPPDNISGTYFVAPAGNTTMTVEECA